MKRITSYAYIGLETIRKIDVKGYFNISTIRGVPLSYRSFI